MGDHYGDLIHQAIRMLEARGVCHAHSVKGCTEEEIGTIEKDVGGSLPRIYREYLASMGRQAGRFYSGSHHFYPQILGLTEAARELVGEDPAQIMLPQDAIVFSMHQGYQFLFMVRSEGDDPPVYLHFEGRGRFEKLFDSFSQYLLSVASE